MRRTNWGRLSVGDACVTMERDPRIIYLKADFQTSVAFLVRTGEFAAVETDKFPDEEVVFKTPPPRITFSLETDDA